MSLVVWLPLIKDTENQGLLSLPSPSLNLTTQSASGKLGSCYEGALVYHFTSDPLATNTWSLCCWVKFTGSLAPSGNNDILICKNSDQMSPTQFYFSVLGGTTLNICIDSYGYHTVDYTFSLNTWYHLACTYNGSIWTLYINGEKKGSGSYTASRPSNMLNLGIGCRSNNTAGTGATSGTATKYFNDVRIYNHCLSPKEVKEISNGLVLHYKLDQPNPNLLLNAAREQSGNSQTAHILYYYYSSFSYLPTGTYTFSFDAKTSNGTDNCYVSYANGASTVNRIATLHSIPSTWTHYSYTFTNSSSNSNDIFFTSYKGYGGDGTNTNNTGILYVRNVKLEKGSIETPFILAEETITIYDSSGYQNNGTISGTLTANADTRRYGRSTYFNGSSYIESDPLPAETYTICAWVKWSSVPTSSGIYSVAVHDKQSGLAMGYAPSGKFITYVGSTTGGSGSCVTLTPTANTWYHIAIVKTGSNTRDVYINGVKATPTTNNYWGGDLNKLNIGCRHNSSSYSAYFNGTMSDFRAYATALSEAEIKKLYDTTVSYDKNGNLFPRELYELEDKISFTKTGLTKSNEFIEDTSIKFTNENITKSNSFIEY